MSVIKTLSDRDHVLLRPGMYIGDTHVRSMKKLLLRGDSIREEEIVYNQGLERIFLEVLYNAADNCERSVRDGVDPGTISVIVKNGTVVVKNFGNPFPIGEEVDGMYAPERALGMLRSGSNFETTNRSLSGTNGVGSTITNIFSTVFDVKVFNHIEKKKMHIQWKNNMVLSKKEIDEYDGPSYTKISFIADFSKFYDSDTEFECMGIRSYSNDMIDSYAKHCIDVALTSSVPVIFNNRVFNISDIHTYAQYIWPNISNMKTMDIDTDDTRCLLIDTTSGRSLSFVNGIYVTGGGVHVDAWQKAVTKPILPILKKLGLNARSAYKNVFKYLSMILVSRYKNIEFSEQIKDKLISPTPDIPPLSTTSLSKWDGIITMAKRIKAIASTLDNVTKKNDGKKCSMAKVEGLSDAEDAGGPNSHNCTLYIVEGKSAKGMAVKVIDGKTEGALPIRGKLINVSKCDKEDYEKNEEIRLLNKVLGLKEETDYSGSNFSQLRYGRVVTMTDADCDGQHIIGLIYNFFRKRYPSLITRGYLSVMRTPLIRVVAGRRRLVFYSGPEYRSWVEKNPSLKHTAAYYKGLSSNDDEEALEAIQLARIVEYKWDEYAEENMAMAFDKGSEDERKEWLLSWNPSLGTSSYAEKHDEDSISHFIYQELCEFSHTNVQRSIPSLVDGLKQSQRKIITVVMKMKEKLKVSQLKGQVSSKMHYKYGEESLYHSIVNMGDYHVGSNNIPLIKAHGQYNSRQGHVAGKDRYIYAAPSKVLPLIFRKEDSVILEYRHDEGDKIEPYHYYPIIPLFSINSTDGIGSGFAMSIPAHSPLDIIKYIIWWLKRKEGDTSQPPELRPYWNNYKGKIYKKGDGWYSEGSYTEIESRKKIKDIRISELPVTTTIDSYLKKLEHMIQASDRKIEYKSSAKKFTYKYKGDQRIEVVPNIIISGFIPLTDDPLKELGLVEKIPVDSVVLLDHNSIPKIYSNDLYSALSDFCSHRYDAYNRRMNTLIKIWEEQIDILEKKKRYIRDVIDGTLSFRTDNNKPKKKQVLIQEVIDRGYPEDFLKISILSISEEGIDTIDNEIEGFVSKVNKYKSSTPSSLWKEELKDLHTYLYK